jgi:hypothetical protein
MTKTIFVICCLLGWGTTAIFAQKGTVTTGGVATGAGGTVTYTIGETNYVTATGSGGLVTQGLQQPYEIFAMVATSTELNVNLSLYPNPTSEYVIINVEGGNTDNLRYELYDMDGRLLATSKMESNETNILMREYASATYFVKVINNKNESKNFKINKN